MKNKLRGILILMLCAAACTKSSNELKSDSVSNDVVANPTISLDKYCWDNYNYKVQVTTANVKLTDSVVVAFYTRPDPEGDSVLVNSTYRIGGNGTLKVVVSTFPSSGYGLLEGLIYRRKQLIYQTVTQTFQESCH